MTSTQRRASLVTFALLWLGVLTLGQAEPAPAFESSYGKDSSPARPAQGDPLSNQGQNRIARAFISNGNGTAVVDPDHSYNPSGGPIDAVWLGTGSYTVTFLGLRGEERGETHFGNWQAQAHGSADEYCSLGGFSASTNVGTVVNCYDSMGRPADTTFILWWIPPSNGENISFTQGIPTGDNTDRARSYTTVRSVTGSDIGVTPERNGLGDYTVFFHNIDGGLNGGTAHVTAAGNGAPSNYCTVNDQFESGNDFAVTVQCFDPFGAPVDSFYWIAVVPNPMIGIAPGHNPVGLGAALALQPTASAYSGLANFSHNPRGTNQDVRFSRSGRGQYRVVFEDIDPLMMGGTSAIVTPCTGSGRCTVEALGHSGSDLSADIRCFDFAGQPRDMTYSVALLGYPFQNLVQNGSFEDPSIGPGINGFVSTVPGWSSDIFDIWSGLNGMPAYDGAQNLELDTSDAEPAQGIPPGISQSIPTTPGTTYLLTFAVANHPQSNVSRVEAHWNGIPVQAAQQIDTTWSIFEAQVVATGSVSRLEFKSTGPADSLGDFLDDVRLVEIALGGEIPGGGGPTISGLVPLSVAAGSGSFMLRVNGTNFCDASSVLWNGDPIETTFQAGGPFGSPAFLSGFVDATLVSSEGEAAVTVVNPGGLKNCEPGMSQPATFTIDPAGEPGGDPPVITSITPETIPAGSGSFTLRVDGPHFCPASTIRFNDEPLATTLHGAGQIVAANIHLTAEVSGILIADPGLAAITVENPVGGPGCVGDGVSNELILTIAGPPIAIAEDVPPIGVVGETYSFTVMAIGGTPPFEFRVVSGSLPPGLELGEGGTVSGQPTEAGIFTWTALVSDVAVETAVREFSIQIDQSSSEPPKVSVAVQPLTFSFSGGSASKRKAIAITNEGGQAAAIGVSTRTDDGANWLTVSPDSGEATAVSPLDVVVQADPAGLAPGSYFGEVLVDTSAVPSQSLLPMPAQDGPLSIPVSMTISERQSFLRLSLDGLTFTAVNTGGPPNPLSFDLFNDGGEALTATARADTFPAGGGWLSLPVSQFNVEGGGQTSVAVQVSQEGLGSGVYQGFVEIRAAGASGGGRLLPVTMNVLPGASRPPLRVEPSGILIRTVEGGTPAPRMLSIQNLRRLGSEPNTFESVRLSDGPDPFVNSPSSGPIPPDDPVEMAIRTDVSGLSAGVRQSLLVLTFDDGSEITVPLTVVIAPADAANLKDGKQQDACATRLIPIVESFSGGLQAYAGSPGFVRVRVSDDCGEPMLAGPSNEVRVDLEGAGEPPMFLSHIENGRWDATVTATLPANVVVNVTATDGTRGLSGQASTAATIDEAIADPPAIFADGIRQAASFASQPLAPGSFVTIFGTALSQPASDQGGGAVAVPLPETLAATSVFVAGATPAPMVFALGSQLNIILPFEQDPNAGPVDVLILRGSTPSAPFELQIAPAEPGIFTIGSAGVGEGVVQDAAFRLVSRQIPGARPGVSPGDVVIIYATGLGAVNPPVLSGTASPASPLAVVANEVRVEIGGQNAQIGFAGLTPAFVSLYQLNVVIPPGLAPGDAEIVIFVAGRPSPSGVTLAIQ